MPSSFAERLAARAGRPTLPPSAPAPAPDAEAVVAALRRDLNVIVEPAIARLRRSEERRGGSDEECFRTAAGRHLRYRCCVYFTALAAGLLEQRYGLLAAAAPQPTYLRYSTSASSATTGAALPPYDGGDAVPDAGGREAPSPYGAMARWLLQPSAGASSEARARAELLMAQAERAMDGYNVRRLGAAAGQLPGPVGRYEVALRIGGVTGTLWRCEVSTVHTFLLFSAARMDDVIIDVTYKQFLVLPEWMESRHFEAAQRANLFGELPEAFVGSASDLASLMTLPALERAMRAAYRRAGDDDDAVLRRYGATTSLREMHRLLVDGLFALGDRVRRRQMCGHPTQFAAA